MKKLIERVKTEVSAFFIAMRIGWRALRKTLQTAKEEENYLTLLSREERNAWVRNVYNAHADNELLLYKMKLIRKAIEESFKEQINAA